MNTIDLSGKWTCKYEDGTFIKEVNLPGSSCENEIGQKQEYYDSYVKEAVRAPRERYEYIGKLIYEKEVFIPEEYEGMFVTLFFERVNIASKVWIDDIEIGRGIIELSAPHIYKVTDRVDRGGKILFDKISGKHTIKVLVDNTNILNMGDMASGYSVDTGGYWNGIVGRMEIQFTPKYHIESVQVYPESDGIRIDTVTISDRHIPMDVKQGSLVYSLKLPDGRTFDNISQNIEVYSTKQRNHFFIKLDEWDRIYWSEFKPVRYELTVTFLCENYTDSYIQKFGYRRIGVKNKRFVLNDKYLSLRGTINCAQYPLTGYPPMDLDTWVKHFRTLKEYGFNHVRCHAWCPPEAAFEAADILGIYLSVEMPLWLNRDVAPMELGDDDWHEMYYRTEGRRILDTYGNHPSFIFFPNGNENMGDYALLESMCLEMKAYDNRHLYTQTSNFDHPLSPVEDYLSAFEIQHYAARIQFLQDEVAKSTGLAYDEMVENVPVPFASFEVGQYCVYPDVDICERYTGNMLPVNFDIIRKMMKEKGVYSKLHDYIMASGDLAAKLYKEDIEAVLRTEGMGGFQLLSFVDYTGQSTATVGILDIFHESKGIISNTEWKNFCNEVVPLFEAKRIFSNKEKLEATVSLYDFGPSKIENPTYDIDFRIKNKSIYKTSVTGKGKHYISFSFDNITENAEVDVYVSADGNGKVYSNSWRIFVFCEDDNNKLHATPGLYVNTKEELENAISEGGVYIASPNAFSDCHMAKNSFIPVFWSPVHFPSEDPCGGMIDYKHPALSYFPTMKYIDYQWKSLLENSVSMTIADIPSDDYQVIVEMVPNYVDNVPKSPLFVMKKGNAKIIFCGFNLDNGTLESKALKKSLEEYALRGIDV